MSPDQLTMPSVCDAWTVRELANHLVLYSSHGLEHRALRVQLPDELVQRDFTAEADWAEQYAAPAGARTEGLVGAARHGRERWTSVSP